MGAKRARVTRPAPNVEIIVRQYYNPFFVLDPITDALVGELDEAIAGVGDFGTSPHGERIHRFQQPGPAAAGHGADECLSADSHVPGR